MRGSQLLAAEAGACTPPQPASATATPTAPGGVAGTGILLTSVELQTMMGHFASQLATSFASGMKQVIDAAAKSSGASPEGDCMLVVKPECFDGHRGGMQVQQWLADMGRFLKTRCMPDRQVATAESYLRGAASVHWDTQAKLLVEAKRKQQCMPDGSLPAPESIVITWEEFCVAMQRGFGGRDPEYAARERLEELRQTGTVEEYARKFESELALIVSDPMAETDKVRLFLKGLTPHVHNLVYLDPLTGERHKQLAVLVERAVKMDQQRVTRPERHTAAAFAGPSRKRAAENAAYAPAEKGKKSKKTAHARKPAKGTWHQSLKVTPELRKRAGDNCFRCLQPGHIAKQCPVPASQLAGGSTKGAPAPDTA
jgi:hypothetical protein